MAKNTSTTKAKRDKDFLRKPKYEGGSKAFKAFIAENLQYPPEALEKKIQGDVHVKYDVDEEGNVLNCKVMRAIGGGCDEEAIRVVRMLKYIPARNRGTHVTTHHDVVLHFRLPVAAPPLHAQSVIPAMPTSMNMNYVYVPATTSSDDARAASDEEKASPVVFRWTIERS